jgi:hypothetical protein
LILLCAGTVFSQGTYKTDADEANAYNVTRTTKTVQSLNFNVQGDRPIEKVAGVYRPLDIDAYVALKFNEVDKRVTVLNKKVNRTLDDILTRLSDLSTRVDALDQRVQELAVRQDTLAQNQTCPLVQEKTAPSAEDK